jgi:hypothetical protein
MTFFRRVLLSTLMLMVLGFAQFALAQNNQSWTSTSQQDSPNATINPLRTTESHTESDGRVMNRNSVQTMGMDGRYVPYSDIESQTVRVNDSTVRSIQRAFGRDVDGHRVLIQEKQEEIRSLPGGAQSVTRTFSNPDANGALQVVQRESEDSKQISPGVRVTNSTIFSPDINGGLSAAVRTEQRERRASDGTIESSKSTLLNDGTGAWKLSEVHESTSRPESPELRTNEERIFRPDSTGKLALAERTVSHESQANGGEKRETVDTYSTNVPGVAGDSSLQLVERSTAVQRNSAGTQSTIRQVEQPNPGSIGGSLHVTQEAIDIVRSDASGNARQSSTILTPAPDGRMGQVWVDTGKTDNPAAIQVDTKAPVQKAAKK